MDGFCGAYWRRPTAYLDPTVRRSISSVAMLATSLVDDAVARLSRDLASGQWTERYQPLLDRDELDLGYCLIAAGE
jgi:hypothetical protein